MENDDNSVKKELDAYLKELGDKDSFLKKEIQAHIELLKTNIPSLKENPNKVIIKEKKKQSFIKWLLNKK